MQLDKTSIVIEQRSADEIFDLSLVVLRNYWQRLVPLAVLGTLPFFVLNLILLQPFMDFDRLVMSSSEYTSREGFMAVYLWVMCATVYLQSPLAMTGVTYYLGQAVFTEEPSSQQVISHLRKHWLSLSWILGLVRGGLLCLFTLAYTYFGYANTTQTAIAISVYMLIIYLIRGFRPFAAEILLLELRPVLKDRSNPDDLLYARRSRWLHASSGDLFSVQMGLTMISFAFVAVFSLGGLFIIGVLLGTWTWGWWMNAIIFPIVLWMMALWGTVIRFLLYMNTRIRSEGWEIELKLRAESQRLVGAT